MADEEAPTRPTLNLGRKTTALVIDHHTIHHGYDTVSIHYQETDAAGGITGGGDVDGVTPEELGIASPLTDTVSEAGLCAFVESISDGVPVRLFEPPPPLEMDPAVEAARVAEQARGAQPKT